jgi:hypothetical protein
MKQLISSVVIATFVSIILVACSGENKPATSELKTALVQNMPGHIELNSFSVQASQNFGNNVEPIYGTRFNATVIVLVDLYKTDKRDKEVTFVRLVTKKGKQTEIFGKITSKLYQGTWKHNINIDGTPILNLGVPLNQVSAGHVIIRGSDKEKKYYAEIERKEKERQAEIKRKEAELRKNLANASKILIGTWRDENILGIYKANGTVHCKYDNGNECIYGWRIEGDMIYYTGKKYKKKNGRWKPNKSKSKARLLYIDKNRVITKGSGGTRQAKRVE